jgi:enterochelin esterase family protein
MPGDQTHLQTPSTHDPQPSATPLVGNPATTNLRGAGYPHVHADGRVTFQISAPAARTVQLQPGGDDNGLGVGLFDMRRDADGVWTVTTAPAVPGFHYYWFLVDGIQVNDPGSETFCAWGRLSSGVEVPEERTDFYDIKDVPHGEVRIRWYHSRVTGVWRRATVYTPPGYDADPRARFPVLYLQHGASEDELGWTRQGRANFILDNRIAAGEAVPMIVVMDCGYAEKPNAPATTAPGQPFFHVQTAAFEDVALEDLVPMIDATYRTRAEAEGRAMAGLSMGGFQALQIALGHPGVFAYVGSFSGAPIGGEFDAQTAYGGVFRDPEAFHARYRLLWLGAGTEEPRCHVWAAAMHGALAGAGIHSVFVESVGTSHEWQTWRRALRDFAGRLFRG